MALCFPSKRLSKEGGVPCVVTMNTIINREKKEANLGGRLPVLKE